MLFTTIILIGLLSKQSIATDGCEDVPNSKAAYEKKTGRFRGCELILVPDDSIYFKLGLKVGDVIKPEGVKIEKALEMKSDKKQTLKVH